MANASLHERMFAVVSKSYKANEILNQIKKITSREKSILQDVTNNLLGMYPSLRKEDITNATILFGIEPAHTFITTGEVPDIFSISYGNEMGSRVSKALKTLLKDETNISMLWVLIMFANTMSPGKRGRLLTPDSLITLKKDIMNFMAQIKKQITKDVNSDPEKFQSIKSVYSSALFLVEN